MFSGSSVNRESDQFRQGIYARGFFERRGTIPILGPAQDSFFIENSTFGQTKTFTDDTAFEDIFDFDPVAYINDISGSTNYAVSTDYIDITDSEQMNGVIEPFTIRTFIDRSSVDYPLEMRSVKGSIEDGNEDTFGRSSLVFQEFLLHTASITSPFMDSIEVFGYTSGAVHLPGYIASEVSIIRPYSDQEKVILSKFGVTITGQDMQNALIAMNPDTQDLISNDSKSAGAGFTYTNANAGTDSIAFGGLLK